MLERFNTMLLENKKATERRNTVFAKSESMNSSNIPESMNSSHIRMMKDKIIKMDKSEKEEEEKKQKEIKENKIVVDKTKMNERISNLFHDQEESFTSRRRKTISYNVENFNSKNVERTHQIMKNNEIAKKEQEIKKQKEIKEQKFVNKTKISERIDIMIKEKKEKEKEIVNNIIKNSVFSENTKENYNKNKQLFQLNEQNIKKIYGEKYNKLSEEDKIHLFDRKINNCEIKEKINLNITMKNPNKEYKYETEIYDDENKLITKTEQQQSDKNEIIFDTEMLYKFTKSQSIKIVIYKHINLNETIRTTMTIPLKKIISKTNNKIMKKK